MKMNLFVEAAFYFFIVLATCNPIKSYASEIVGDINDNGKVGLEEGIYALQVTFWNVTACNF